ncbi:MAG: hypothetical protein IJF27_05170 [Oscillospiraceae bacterium]|nr:hypothetical protein [Oscillospiraceae bacterium]
MNSLSPKETNLAFFTAFVGIVLLSDCWMIVSEALKAKYQPKDGCSNLQQQIDAPGRGGFLLGLKFVFPTLKNLKFSIVKDTTCGDILKNTKISGDKNQLLR